MVFVCLGSHWLGQLWATASFFCYSSQTAAWRWGWHWNFSWNVLPLLWLTEILTARGTESWLNNQRDCQKSWEGAVNCSVTVCCQTCLYVCECGSGFVTPCRVCSEPTEEEEGKETGNDTVMSDVKEDGTMSEHSLWVDKYSPRHFTELLSDDVRVWSFCGESDCDCCESLMFWLWRGLTGCCCRGWNSGIESFLVRVLELSSRRYMWKWSREWWQTSQGEMTSKVVVMCLIRTGR